MANITQPGGPKTAFLIQPRDLLSLAKSLRHLKQQQRGLTKKITPKQAAAFITLLVKTAGICTLATDGTGLAEALIYLLATRKSKPVEVDIVRNKRGKISHYMVSERAAALIEGARKDPSIVETCVTNLTATHTETQPVTATHTATQPKRLYPAVPTDYSATRKTVSLFQELTTEPENEPLGAFTTRMNNLKSLYSRHIAHYAYNGAIRIKDHITGKYKRLDWRLTQLKAIPCMNLSLIQIDEMGEISGKLKVLSDKFPTALRKHLPALAATTLGDTRKQTKEANLKIRIANLTTSIASLQKEMHTAASASNFEIAAKLQLERNNKKEELHRLSNSQHILYKQHGASRNTAQDNASNEETSLMLTK